MCSLQHRPHPHCGERGEELPNITLDVQSSTPHLTPPEGGKRERKNELCRKKNKVSSLKYFFIYGCGCSRKKKVKIVELLFV